MKRVGQSLAGQGETERGAVFTRPEVVAALLDLAGYTVDRPLHQWRLLEPSFGAGDFLLTAVQRLLESFMAAGGSPARGRQLRAAIRGVEVHPGSFDTTREAVKRLLIRKGFTPAIADTLCESWLVRDDFLLAPLEGMFDVVIGNPPYVRQERIPTPLMAEYRRRYSTIYDRADLYVPFFERGLQLLGKDGRLAFICANRWLKNKYGGPLRGLIARDFHLSHYIDMEGTDAFKSEVIAYPAITVIRRGEGILTRIARRPDSILALPGLVRALLKGGPRDERIEEVERVVRGSEPWLLDAAAPLQVLRRLEKDFPEMEDAGCKVGIGVATGADRVFIGEYGALPVEEARKLPLLMARDLQDGVIVWGGKGVVNPFETDGSLASLKAHPNFGAYIRKHQEILGKRHVAQKSGGAWYRTIDRIYTELTKTPKLLIPDIKGEPMVVFDEGQYYPHHNLYHVTSSSWDLRALATLLRSSIAVLFVSTYCVKMSGGFLRFQAQYLRRICVPRWESLSASQRKALAAAAPTDRAAIDEAAFAAYGLTEGEGGVVRAAANSALVQRKGQ